MACLLDMSERKTTPVVYTDRLNQVDYYCQQCCKYIFVPVPSPADRVVGILAVLIGTR